jgi:dTDP-4-amino-4,6-dideoxygalactose transaminase
MISSTLRTETPAAAGGDPVRAEFLHFAQPKLSESEISAVVETLRSGWLTTASKAHEFERSFREYVGCSYAVAVNSCTAGLFLSLKVLGIGPGDEVITTPFTFVATANVIEHVGARPVFADIDPATWCIDLDLARKKITSATRAIMPVHIYGLACDMDSLLSLAKESGLYAIQDCAHAIETEWRGSNVGSFGDFACYSFYATKNVTTGEGGMVATNRDDWAEQLRVLALHGLDRTAYDRYSAGGKAHYDVRQPGYKFNMPDIAAALGLEGLKLVEARHERRAQIWNRYFHELADLPGLTMPPDSQPQTRHARHIFAVAVDPAKAGLDRDRMIECLRAENIGAGIHFAPVHFFEYYRNKYGMKPDDLPVASRLGSQVVSLPLTPYLSEADVDDVIRATRRIVLYHARKLA